jgi:hypothetical protein
MTTNLTAKYHLLLLFFLLAVLWASPAWAVQSHGGAEGLVSHEIGHILFITGMGYLLYRIYRVGFSGAGWSEFKYFLWLIICWNILTFSGHWLQEFYGNESYIRENGQITAFHITSFTDFIFYLSHLDHLLLVPSFLFLLQALKKWRLQP